MIYVPEKDNYKCYVVRSEEVIRAYKTVPTTNSTVEYRDYYYNSNYLYNDGTQTFSQYSTLPVCLSDDVLTSAYGYRNDFADICIIAIILIGSVWFLISKLIKVTFKGKKLY